MTLIVLMGAGMPMKYFFEQPLLVKILGPIHGAFFLLFVFYAFLNAIEESWGFQKVTLKLLIASFIPFGNFYVDRAILKPLHESSSGATT
jgi:integral membrane protein